MKFILKWLGRLLLVVIAAGVGLWFFGPKEPVDLDVTFDATVLNGGVQAHLDASEAAYPDIIDGVNKRVIWAGAAEQKTPVSVVYIHGFSATSEEIRPVPDRVAQALGANLVYTRLKGHGRTGAAMAEPSAGDWMYDTLEALAVGRAVGERVIVISTSTGGTVLAAAALREDAMQNVAGLVFVSPNFAINNPAAPMLTWPAARWWVPLLVGADRSFEPANDAHAQYWTTQYPTVAALPMAALVEAVDALDLGGATTPALFIISDQDRVVSPVKTREVSAEWGGPVQVEALLMGEGDDAYAHVIAGDIMSPGQTDNAIELIAQWAAPLLQR